MYDLPYFKEHDTNRIETFIKQYPFALVNGCDTNGLPVATQLPVFLENKSGVNILRGHIMKNTDHHQAFLLNPTVLVVFTGPNCYVSGTWYKNPFTPSTWNYMSVYCQGKMHMKNNDDLIEILRKTTLHFENNNPSSSTIYDNLPADLTQGLMKAITAFEIEITRMDAVFKLSQNHDEVTYRNIIDRLSKMDHNSRQIASEMEVRIKELYPSKP